MTALKEQRSGIATENLQEVLDASSTTGIALTKGSQQYCSPTVLVDRCLERLKAAGLDTTPDSILDPQVGEGALLKTEGYYGSVKFGIDLDNRIKAISGVKLITGNCVKAFEIVDDLYPDLRFQCGNANPPFTKWKVGGKTVDSTKLTWDWITKHACYGYFIANHNTLVDLGIAPDSVLAESTSHLVVSGSGLAGAHPWVFHYEVHKGTDLWKGMRDELRIGVAFWKNPASPDPTDTYELRAAWDEVQRVLNEERGPKPEHNIFLDHKGYLRTYLSVRSELKLKLTTDQINRLHQVNDCHPLTLTTEKETRDLMQSLIDCGIYTLQPEAKAAIQSALKEVESLAVPIMPVTPFECVAYAEESEVLDAAATVDGKLKLTAGKRYPISTGTYKFTDKFTRNKVHYDDKTMTTYTKEHHCTLSGEDRYIQLQDDNGQMHRFMDRPAKGCDWQHDESLLWGCFHRPVVKTIAEAKPQEMERNAAILKSLAMIAGFEYYEGQAKYLARVAAKDCGLVAGSGGTGKSLMALSIIAMKSPVRALIVAPQGTMRSSENDDDGDSDEDGSADMTASQWIQEIHRFTPYLQVWELFSYEDYERICSLNGGVLPPGLYVTYPEAFFGNFVEQ